MAQSIRVQRFLTLLLLTATLVLAGCLGDPTVPAPASAPPPPPALTVLPGTATVLPGTTTVFTISGGVKGYSVFSSNSSIIPLASNTVVNSTFAVTAANVFVDTPVTLTIIDAANTKVEVTVTVKTKGSELLAVSPANASGTVGQVVSFVVTGGAPEYSVTSSVPATVGVSSVSAAGGRYIFTATLVGVGTSSLAITDAAKNIITVPVTVSGAMPLFTTAQPNVTIPVGGKPTTYTIGGGDAPYTATSSNVSVASVTVTGTSVSIMGVTEGTANVGVRDSTGSVVTISVTVNNASVATPLFTTAQPAITIPASTTPTNFTIGGGTAPYTATSSNASVATVVVSGTTFGITGKTEGTANIGVRDATGTVVTISVTVNNDIPAPLFTTAQSSITIPVSTTPTTFTLGGGTAPYSATSSNTAVAKVSVSGTTLSITGVAGSTANIAVRDAAGNSLTINVTVSAPLYTTAAPVLTLAAGSTGSYTIAGGTPPYAVSSRNPTVASVNVSSPTFTIKGEVAGGPVDVVVYDATGSSLTISVTVGTSAVVPLFTTAPVAITLPVGGTGQTFTVGGSSPPYLVSSDNTSVASVTGSTGTTLKITGVSDGKANVVVKDATGSASVSIAVNVGTGSGFNVIGSSPSWTITGNGDGNLTNDCSAGRASPVSVFFINGGSPPYTVTSSSPLVGTIIGTDTAPPSSILTAQSVSLSSVTVSKGGYFVVAWPNANNNCAAGVATFRVLDSTGAVPATAPTFTVTFTPS